MATRTRKPTHPGAILREDILPELGMSQAELARRLAAHRVRGRPRETRPFRRYGHAPCPAAEHHTGKLVGDATGA